MITEEESEKIISAVLEVVAEAIEDPRRSNTMTVRRIGRLIEDDPKVRKRRLNSMIGRTMDQVDWAEEWGTGNNSRTFVFDEDKVMELVESE